MRRYRAIDFAARRALNRIEAVVIVALVALGAGLLVLVISRARGDGLRVQCLNNLRQIGQAAQRFHDTAAPIAAGELGGAAHFLPAARIADGYATWAVQIGPQLLPEGHPLLGWDMALPYRAQPDEARQALVTAYFCPARTRPDWLSAAEPIGALGDYAGVAGDGSPPGAWTGSEANGAIILGDVLAKKGERIVAWRGRVRRADLERGQEATLLFGEKHVPPDGLGNAKFGDGSLYDGALPASCTRVAGPGFGLALSPDAPYQTNFGGPHPGVCQFGFADTSARALTVTISDEVLGQLARRGK